jgi:precorrin-2 dehydrogenase/sirohydrochlorin ferrochelatase
VSRPEYYPIFFDLTGRNCLVVGGGAVAEGKVRGLLAANARVSLVAPVLTPELQELAASGRIAYRQAEYDASDLEGATLCFVATDDGVINARVATDARARNVPVNAADDPANCDFILPAVVRSGSIVLAASTGGASPALARRLREDLTAFLDEGYAPLGDVLATVRSEVRAAGRKIDPEAWQAAIDARLRTLIAQGRLEDARRRLRRALGLEDSAGDGEA